MTAGTSWDRPGRREAIMAMDERSKLKTILEHWIGHNREHALEFAEWAEKARAMGEDGVARDIDEAVRAMDGAGEKLSGALEKLGEA